MVNCDFKIHLQLLANKWKTISPFQSQIFTLCARSDAHMKYRVLTRKSQINNIDKEKDVNSIIRFGDSEEIYFPFFSVIKLLCGNCREFLNCKINGCDFYRVLAFKQKHELSEGLRK